MRQPSRAVALLAAVLLCRISAACSMPNDTDDARWMRRRMGPAGRRRPGGLWLLVLALAGALMSSPLACAGPNGGDPADEFRPAVTTEGNVTTVVNGPGSVWGGSARLIEEASIGVETGAAEYMFGRPGGVYATGDRIYVIDTQVPTVRVFDFDGLHLFSFGQAGQGPGEFNDPYSIGGSDDGRIFVGDYGSRRINVYSGDGEFLANYPMGSVRCCVRQMVVTHDGVPWVQMREYSEADPVGENARMQGHDENGPFGELRGPPEIEFEPATIMFDGRESMVRFTPMIRWVLAPSGAIIAGASDRYRFEVRHPQGQVLVVERHWEPVPLHPDEREWSRLSSMASRRRSQPGWTWNGAEIPDAKPAFQDFIASHTGEIWVVRPGPGIKDPECDDKHDPDDFPYYSRNWRCWRDQPLIDVFDAEGVYLGDLEVPEGIVLNSIAPPHVRGDTVIAALYEPDGVIRVKRYRIAPPGALNDPSGSSR